MRALFLLFVAANLGFYAWTLQQDPRARGADPAPLARQIEPGRLKIIAPAQPQARPAARDASTCVEWGSFSVAEAARAQEALAPLALGPLLTERRGEETARWWVYLPPQANRAAAQRKAEELKSLGIEEYFVMQDEGRLRWAISLGVFRSEESAKARLEALRAKKVRGAQIGEREAQVTKVWLQVTNADESLQGRMRGLAAQFPGTELRQCAAGG
jgi:hypothetical protein